MGLRGNRRDPLIRAAQPHEAAQLAGLAARAYGIYVGRIGRRPAPMDADYQSPIRDGRAFVADDRGSIVGLIVLVPHPDHLLIENVAVEPARQGRGIGRALMAYAEGYARAHRLLELRLYTNAAMTENLSLYPRFGYQRVGRRTEAGFDRVFFAKTLPPAETSADHGRFQERWQA